MKKALILVDIQNDFCPGGALAVPEGDHVVAVANRLVDQFDLVVATQDWHPENHKSFASNHDGGVIGTLVKLDGLDQILWPDHCVQKSFGSQFVTGLNMTTVANIFQKGTDVEIDSYSGFFDNGRRKATGLGDYLKEKGVDTIYVMGLATDYCIKFTALDGKQLGFDTYLIEDGVRGVGLAPEDIPNAIKEMKDTGIKIIQSVDI